jgi:hypothetical protein
MRQWRLERPYRPESPAAEHGLALPWWAYPSSAVAMLLLAALVWWGFRSDPIGNQFVTGPANNVFVAPIDPSSSPDAEAGRPQAFAYADPLDQAYLELRSIQELADGL